VDGVLPETAASSTVQQEIAEDTPLADAIQADAVDGVLLAKAAEQPAIAEIVETQPRSLPRLPKDSAERLQDWESAEAATAQAVAQADALVLSHAHADDVFVLGSLPTVPGPTRSKGGPTLDDLDRAHVRQKMQRIMRADHAEPPPEGQDEGETSPVVDKKSSRRRRRNATEEESERVSELKTGQDEVSSNYRKKLSRDQRKQDVEEMHDQEADASGSKKRLTLEGVRDVTSKSNKGSRSKKKGEEESSSKSGDGQKSPSRRDRGSEVHAEMSSEQLPAGFQEQPEEVLRDDVAAGSRQQKTEEDVDEARGI
jgi:hypothetical protein